MGLEFDTLKSNDDCTVVYNNTTGAIVNFGYTLKDFLDSLFDEFRVRKDQVKDYFTMDEIKDFFDEHDIDYTEEKLDELFSNNNC